MKVEELQLWESVPNTIKFIDQQLSQFVDELSYAMYHVGKLAETVPGRHVTTMPCDSCNTVYGCAHESTVKKHAASIRSREKWPASFFVVH